MRFPTLLTAAGLLTLAALGHSQAPPPPPIPAPSPVGPPVPATPSVQPAPYTPPAVPGPAPVSPLLPPTPVPSTSPPQIQTLLLTEPPVSPPEQSVDQLIAELERLKTQKAQIEKQEQAVKDTLAKKLGEQNERLKKLGVEKKEEPKPEPIKPRVEPEVTPRTAPSSHRDDWKVGRANQRQPATPATNHLTRAAGFTPAVASLWDGRGKPGRSLIPAASPALPLRQPTPSGPVQRWQLEPLALVVR